MQDQPWEADKSERGTSGDDREHPGVAGGWRIQTARDKGKRHGPVARWRWGMMLRSHAVHGVFTEGDFGDYRISSFQHLAAPMPGVVTIGAGRASHSGEQKVGRRPVFYRGFLIWSCFHGTLS